uniref:Uncharacterized protein n=1 Tax=Plectus sambesii TaxID=2011161 RepID=A0A914VFY3_9BILA
MWYEERSGSWSNMKMSSIIVEEWRDLWSFKIDFLIVAFAYVFATTNFLNLPKMILENGGLAFVAAMGAALLICVLPIIVMELAVGQLTGRAPVQAFYNICPLFKGVGVAQILFSLAIMSYLAIYIGWLMLFVFYLFWSIVHGKNDLPWLSCEEYPEFMSTPCLPAGLVANFTQTTPMLNVDNSQSSMNQFITALQRPSAGITEIGEFQWQILSALGLVWILVFFAIFAGVRWLGKVAYFTYIFPFCCLLALLVRALTLDGLMDILTQFYEVTDWERLLDYHLWKLALEQVIWASGIGFGAFITIGSYNKRTSNLVGDSVLIVLAHVIVTAMQLFTIVGLIGYISQKTSIPALDLLSRGESQMWHVLAYMSHLDAPKLWTGIVLFMSIFVLLNVFYVLSLSVLATLEDALGEKSSRCFPRLVLSLFVCILGCALGLFFTTQAGKWALELTKGYLSYITLWTILTFELLAISWFYCGHMLGKDLKSMLSNACCWVTGHFLLYITYLLPIVPIGIMVLGLMQYDYGKYSDGVRSWEWSELVGWAIAGVPLLPIPILMLFVICRTCVKGPGITKWQRFKYTIISPLRYEVVKPTPAPRYTASAPGYVLLPQAPLAEPEVYNDGYTERVVRVSNI